MKCVIYTRFSPRKNAEESESCDVQRDYCLKRAAELGYEVKGVFDDPDVSGADEFRAQLWAAIESLEKGDVLLVYKRDRLARNLYLSVQIDRAVTRRGATIEAVTGDIAGNSDEIVMVRQMLAVIAEYERKMISSRTHHAMMYHIRNGRRMGAECPYGWSPDPVDPKLMVPNFAERELVEQIKCWHECGEAWNAITTKLNRSYAHMARHGKWNVKTVRKLGMNTVNW